MGVRSRNPQPPFWVSRPAVRRPFAGTCLVAGLWLLGTGASSVPAEPAADFRPVETSRPEDRRLRDWHLTVAARRALHLDPSLAPLNLGVRVEDGVVTLWGPVPGVTLISRAQSRLRDVPGMTDVISELTLESDGGWASDAARPSAPPPLYAPGTAKSPEPQLTGQGRSPAASPGTFSPPVEVRSSKESPTTMSPFGNPFRPTPAPRGPAVILLPIEPDLPSGR